MKTLQLNYQFTNSSNAPLTLWLALPSADAHHPQLTVKLNREADATHASADNLIACFELAAQQKLEFDCEFASPNYPLQENLGAEMREFYLRSSSLVNLDDALRRYADNQVAVAADAKTQARQLFTHLLDTYQYQSACTERSAQAMLQQKRGDSMAFALLYAALCRARRIPCRVVFGALCTGTMSPHCWNEIYLENQGWLPVDCGMAKLAKSVWRSLTLGITVLPWQAYFGALEGPRMVFSLDCDLPCPPGYHEHPEAQGPVSRLGGHQIHWGLELLDGKLPYLQPAYVQLDSSYARAASSLSEKLHRARLSTQLLGSWRANFRGNWRYPLQKTWSFALYLYAGEILVSWFNPQTWLTALRSSTSAVVLGLSGALLLWQIVASYLARRQFKSE